MLPVSILYTGLSYITLVKSKNTLIVEENSTSVDKKGV